MLFDCREVDRKKFVPRGGARGGLRAPVISRRFIVVVHARVARGP